MIQGLRRIRRKLLSIIDSPRSLSRTLRRDRQLTSKFNRSHVTGVEGEYHLLLTSTGFRNIGDQAMLEAFAAGVSGKIIAITGPRATYALPSGTEGRLDFMVLPRLVYGRGSGRKRDVRQFAKLLASARSFSVVGADIMDGGYQLRVSAIQWGLAGIAAELGVDTRILGFSWRSNPQPFVAKLAHRAASQGVSLIVRDPHSYERLEKAGVPNITLSSDLVFSAAAQIESNLPEEIARTLQDEGNRNLLILNTSGLISEQTSLIDDYVKIVESATKLGYRVLIIPHVSDISGGDFRVAEATRVEVASRLGLNLEVIPILLSPSQVRYIVRGAELVVTGRMHLAVMATSQGVPSIVLATQGKVTGLMESLGLPELALEPEQGIAEAVIEVAREIAAGSNRYSQILTDHLHEIIERSAKNFHGLQ